MPLGGIESEGVRLGLAVTTLLYGVRHGIDWDHLAAITDVTSAQRSRRRAMRVASSYAAGHGVVVFGLGVVAILGGEVLPGWLDRAMGRMVGATLIALAVYVVWSLATKRSAFRLRSRWMLVADGVRLARRWTSDRFVEIFHDHPHDHDHDHGTGHGHAHPADTELVDAGQVTARVAVAHRHQHRHVAAVPDDPFRATTSRAAAVLGVIHGIGAETPTQVVLFLTAAQVAGGASAVLLLLLFIAGVFVSNTAVAAAASYGYLSATRSFRVYATLALVNAGFSLVVGVVFLTGHELPAIIGG